MEPGCVTDRRSLDEALRLARRALRDHPVCFWTRGPLAELESREDVQLVVRRLRQQGSASAWRAATEIERCRSQWLELAARAELEIERAGSAGIDLGVAFVHARGNRHRSGLRQLVAR